ncbi:MAG: universal stress protein [Methanothrix sp.]|nr:universal stress protein [Methanothrix sp.]
MMFEKVLVPTDFSRYALKMLDCIGEIPGPREVVLLNVVDAGNPMMLEKKGWSYSSLLDDAKADLKKMAEHLERLAAKKGLKVKPVLKVIVEPMSGADGVNLKRPAPISGVEFIEGGTIGEAIQKAADEEKVSLIVMGAHGKGLMEGILLGSVSTEALRSGKTDLLIIRHQLLEGSEKFCHDIFSRVLVTTDFSEAARDAVTLVKGLHGVHEILLAHVVSEGEDIEEPAKKLNVLRDELPGKVTVHVLEGHAADQILALAERQGASLIIMSSQGKGWLRLIRVGSTTFDVARRARQPVLIVRPKLPA